MKNKDEILKIYGNENSTHPPDNCNRRRLFSLRIRRHLVERAQATVDVAQRPIQNGRDLGG